MQALSEHLVNCPYCGERITILLDQSAGEYETIEDCQVCCRPISLFVSMPNEDNPVLIVKHENE